MEVVVQEGGDEYTYDAALGSPNTFHINSLGYTAGSASFDDEIITLFTDSVGDGSGTFITSGLIGSASIDYKNSEGTPVYNKIVRFDLSVSKIGVDGVNGASGSDAKVVSLSSTKYAIVYDGDGNLFPASQPFTLSGSAQNFDDPRFQFLENGSQIQGFSTDSNVVIPTAGNLPTAGGTNLYEVRVKENGGSVEAFDNIDVFGVQSGSDAFTVFLTNEAHVFSATSESVVTSDLSDGSFEVRFFRGSQQYNSGSTGKTYSVSATTSNIVLSQSLESNNQAKFTPTSVSGDSGSAAITITDNNTSQTFNKQYSFTLSKEGINGQDGQDGQDGEDGEDGQDGADGANGVVINISPTSQTIKRSNSGTYDTPKIFTVTVTENGTLLTHQAGTGTPATSKYTITSLSNGTLSAGSGTTSPDITPTTPSAIAGLTTTFNITYTDGKGTTSSALAQSHVVNVVLDGTTGPGIVHTGEWEAGRAYQYADGLSDGDGRIDTVLYSGTYYAATSQHTSTNNTNSSTGVPGSGPWESLGTQDLFVAAKIAIFEDSFVQNTLNIGTNNSGGVSSANITLAGATANPYISIGQSGTLGSQGYAAGDGIFIGRDSADGEYKASFENGSTSYLKWTGTSLDIKGSINITGGSAQSALNSINSTTQSLQDDVNAAQAGVDAINLTTSSLENPTTFTPSTPANTSTGLHLGSDKMGYYNSGWKTYMDVNGNFYLGGDTNGALSWNNSTDQLVITGSIFAENGVFSGTVSGSAIQGGTVTGATLSGGTINVPASNPNFTVSSGGIMTATGATISGSISATAGTFGGWEISGNSIVSPTTGNVRMSLTGGSSPVIVVNNASAEPKVEISSLTSLTSLGAGSATVNNISGYAQVNTSVNVPAATGASPIQVTNEYGTGGFSSVSATIPSSGTYTITFELDYPSGTGNAGVVAAFTNSTTGGGALNSITHSAKIGVCMTTSSSPPSSWDNANDKPTGCLWNAHQVKSHTDYSPGSTNNWYLPADYLGNYNHAAFTVGGSSYTFSGSTTVYFHTYIVYNLTAFRVSNSYLIGVNVDIKNPPIGVATMSKTTDRTEINAGGLQVVSSTSNYVIMERQAGASAANTVMLDVGGSIEATGNITANASDERLKNILGLIENPLDKLKELKGIRFTWNEIANELAKHKMDEEHIGLIAQDVQKVLPEVVKKSPIGKTKDDHNYLTIWYEKLVPLLVEAIKELSDKVDKLEEKNKRLEDGN